MSLSITKLHIAHQCIQTQWHDRNQWVSKVEKTARFEIRTWRYAIEITAQNNTSSAVLQGAPVKLLTLIAAASRHFWAESTAKPHSGTSIYVRALILQQIKTRWLTYFVLWPAPSTSVHYVIRDGPAEKKAWLQSSAQQPHTTAALALHKTPRCRSRLVLDKKCSCSGQFIRSLQKKQLWYCCLLKQQTARGAKKKKSNDGLEWLGK